jgi:hypothetical protein
LRDELRLAAVASVEERRCSTERRGYDGAKGRARTLRRVVRLAVSLVTTPEFREHPYVADAASELLARAFGPDKTSTRMVYGVTSLAVHPYVADAASELLARAFGPDKTSTRMVYSVTSLAVGVCVVVELILEVAHDGS